MPGGISEGVDSVYNMTAEGGFGITEIPERHRGSLESIHVRHKLLVFDIASSHADFALCSFVNSVVKNSR